MREHLRIGGAAVVQGPLEVYAATLLAGDGPARAELYDLPTQSPLVALRAGPDEESPGTARWSADDPNGRRFASLGIQLVGDGAAVVLDVERVDWSGRLDEAAGVVVRHQAPRVRGDHGPGELTDARALRRST